MYHRIRLYFVLTSFLLLSELSCGWDDSSVSGSKRGRVDEESHNNNYYYSGSSSDYSQNQNFDNSRSRKYNQQNYNRDVYNDNPNRNNENNFGNRQYIPPEKNTFDNRERIDPASINLRSPVDTMKDYNEPITSQIGLLQARKKELIAELTKVIADLSTLGNKLEANQKLFEATLKGNTTKTKNLQDQNKATADLLKKLADKEEESTKTSQATADKINRDLQTTTTNAQAQQEKKDQKIKLQTDANAKKISGNQNYNNASGNSVSSKTK